MVSRAQTSPAGATVKSEEATAQLAHHSNVLTAAYSFYKKKVYLR